MRREPRLRRGRARRARARARARRCSSTTTTCTWRRASCASTPRRRRSTHFVHVPWPQPDYWRVLPEADPAGAPRGHPRERRRELPHRPLAQELPAQLRGHRSAPTSTTTPASCASPAESCARAWLRSRSTRASSTRSRRRDACCEEEAAIVAARPEFLVAPRRPHRSVEERRARLPRLRAVPRGAPRAARARRDARAARPVAPGHPGVRGVPRRRSSEPRGLVNDRFQRNGWLPLDLQIQDNFPQAVAAYKQFDVLLVNAIFDGHEPRREGGPARQRAGRRAVLSENAGAHEELAPWALTVNPFDVAGPGRGDRRGPRDAEPRSAAVASRRSGRTCASTTSPAGSSVQLADLDQAVASRGSTIRA